MYQIQCPVCCLHAGPGWERESYRAEDTAEMIHPVNEETTGRVRKEERRARMKEGRAIHCLFFLFYSILFILIEQLFSSHLGLISSWSYFIYTQQRVLHHPQHCSCSFLCLWRNWALHHCLLTGYWLLRWDLHSSVWSTWRTRKTRAHTQLTHTLTGSATVKTLTWSLVKWNPADSSSAGWILISLHLQDERS